ncbi:MAG TPA: hypothetical protein VIF09_06100 [Polyangiaceae bacterium]
MQTLIDPFELASRTLPVPPPPVRPIALTLADLDVQVEAEEPPPRRPSADSCGRVRCWCSED